MHISLKCNTCVKKYLSRAASVTQHFQFILYFHFLLYWEHVKFLLLLVRI